MTALANGMQYKMFKGFWLQVLGDLVASVSFCLHACSWDVPSQNPVKAIWKGHMEENQQTKNVNIAVLEAPAHLNEEVK